MKRTDNEQKEAGIGPFKNIDLGWKPSSSGSNPELLINFSHSFVLKVELIIEPTGNK